jgi:hypothetical protein
MPTGARQNDCYEYEYAAIVIYLLTIQLKLLTKTKPSTDAAVNG